MNHIMGDHKKQYKSRYIMVNNISSQEPLTPLDKTKIKKRIRVKKKNENVRRKAKNTKFGGLWYVIKEKKINIQKDLHIKIVN